LQPGGRDRRERPSAGRRSVSGQSPNRLNASNQRGEIILNVVDFNASLDKASVFLIQRLLDKIKSAIETGEPDGEMTHELVRRTQQLAVESRLLYGRIREPDDNQEAKVRLLELGYRCECGPGEVRIELPLLLPKRGADATLAACDRVLGARRLGGIETARLRSPSLLYGRVAMLLMRYVHIWPAAALGGYP